jgi:hypothetical protein
MHMPLPIIRISGKINRVLTAGVLLWAATLVLQGTAFGQTQAHAGRLAAHRQLPLINADTWNDGTGDALWSTTGNWSNGVPVSSSDVIITNVHFVTQDGSETINTLTVNPGGEVSPLPAVTLEVDGGSIVNNGQLLLNDSTLNAGSSGLTLSGAGSLTMNGVGNSVIMGSSSFTNQSLIQGNGDIGENDLAITNQGIIDANVSGRTLTVNPYFYGMTNTNVLKADAGGTLELIRGVSNGAGASIQANGGTVLLNGVNISGGTLSTSNGGVIQPVASTSNYLQGGLTIAGVYQINSDSSTTILYAGIVNNGQIQLNETIPGHPAILNYNTGGNLTGTGTVIMNGADNQINGNGVLVNQVTIQGLGTINVAGFNNQSMVIGNSTTAPITIECPTGGMCTNTGTVEGEQGGTVALTCTGGSGCLLDDVGGNILNADLEGGVTVSGGTFGGTVEGMNATVDGTSSAVTNSADFVIKRRPNNNI